VDQEGDRGKLDEPLSDTPDDAARIREQIEHTRANLSGTIEELQDRLRPENLVSQAGDAMRATVEQKVKTMANTATDAARRVADQASDTARRVADQAGDTARRVADQAGETARRVAGQARSSAASATEQMQNRPIPTALALGGLTWWLMRSRRDDYSEYDNGSAMRGVMPALAVGALGYYLLSQRMLEQGPWSRRGQMAYGTDDLGIAGEYGDAAQYGEYDAEGGAGSSVGERVRQAGDTAGERVRQAGETADEYRRRVQAAVGTYATQVGEQARHYTGVARARVEETTTMLLDRSEDFAENFDRWMQENPLTVGVAAFALGAIAGLSIPGTETEHRTLGAAREKLMQQAGKAVDSAMSK
jgi:ElaB/YqjD/DUF883 family membrane-anchored ribosome-binding protein